MENNLPPDVIYLYPHITEGFRDGCCWSVGCISEYAVTYLRVPDMTEAEAREALWPGWPGGNRGCLITQADEIGIVVRACERNPAAVLVLLKDALERKAAP